MTTNQDYSSLMDQEEHEKYFVIMHYLLIEDQRG